MKGRSRRIDATLVGDFHRTLLSFGRYGYRPMPWRDTRDPYRILVSEVMLQQTQVSRAMERYPRFIERFPTVRALAEAPLGAVLREWSGLGYNRRAKYLHQCAKRVIEDHDGKFPRTYDALVSLPGIGRSTAGALLAFAFGRDTPMIDTNIRRILIRVFFKGKKKIPTDDELYAFAESIIPPGKGRAWNHAMLDLGATLCSARGHSSDCPLMRLHGPVGDSTWKRPQKKFAGSNRYYRGKALRALASEGSMSETRLVRLLAGCDDPSGVLLALRSEDLIEKRGRNYRLHGG